MQLTVRPRKRIPSSESRTEPWTDVSCLPFPLPCESVAVTHLPHEALDTTSTTIGLVEGDLANDLVAVLPIPLRG